MKKIELLAPVGNMNCLKAAIEAGCDAVYLGGNMFGARAFAGNFNDEELIEAINYAHMYGVKVYLTINTIIYENEVERFLDYVRFVHKNNIDAVIIQDIGMFDLLRKKFPNLELHASTQMNIHNYEGALLAKKLGFKRIVMARETPLEIIKKIKKEIDIEVEVFIHGALCTSYSGQCLLSALVGNRSGNRGTCAQICRKKYNLLDEKENKLNTDNYLLSTKDLCTLENIDEIIDAGVDSLKIEGRMKREEYVYLVTKIYRKAIDSYYKNGKINVSKNDILELKKMFNRSFTKGFMLDENNNDFTYEKRPNHIGIKIGKVLSKKNNDLKIKLCGEVNVHDGLRIIDEKEDKGLVINKMFLNNKSVLKAFSGDVITIKYDKFVLPGSEVLLTSSFNQINKLDDNIKNNKRKVLIDAYVLAKKGEPLLIKITDGKNIITCESKETIEDAKTSPTNKEIIKNQLNKTGNTVYKFNDIKIEADYNIFINVKEINKLRREALKELNKKRLYKIDFIEKDYMIKLPDFKKKRKISILVDDLKNYDELKSRYDDIYLNNKETNLKDVIIKVPRVIEKYKDYSNNVLIGELGSILKYKNFETDFSFNVVNSYSVAFLHSIGAYRVTLSYELTLKQIENIISSYEKRYKKHPNISVIVNSYPEAMISKFNLNKKYNVDKSYLEDSFKNKYKVITEDNHMILYHYEKVNCYDKEELFKLGVNMVRVNILN